MLAVIFLVIVGLFFGQMYLKGKLTDVLENDLPETVTLKYTDLDLSLFRDYFEIQNVEFSQIGETTNDLNLEIKIKKLKVDNIGYWNYLFNDAIEIEDLEIWEPNVVYHHNKQIPKKKYSTDRVFEFKRNVGISHFKISNGLLTVYDQETDSLTTNINGFNMSLKKLAFNAEAQKEKTPITIGSYYLDFDDLFFMMGEYENLTIGNANFSLEASALRDVKLKTKYSESQLSKVIAIERDHFDLEIDSIGFNKLDLGYVKDTVFFVKSPKVVFYAPDFNVYRDKLVADDPKIKSMYGKMLRRLNFDLSLDTVEVKNANIKYSEKVKEQKPAGEIVFSNFNANIENLGNTYSNPKETILHINAKFMEHAPLQVTWKFDVNNTRDEFLFQAELGKLNADRLNKFTQPNFNKRLEGSLDKTYFTIFGNSEQSQIDFKVKYDCFDVVALKKNGREKNKFLSDIFNIFIKKNSNKETNGFVEVIRKDIERNKTKSVFNYIWISTRAGLVKAMTVE